MIGLTSAVSLLILMLLKQNFTIVQAVNWIVAPIQLLMIIPFMRLGAIVLFKDNVSITLGLIIRAFKPGIWEGLKAIGLLHLYGVLGWIIIALPAGVIFYFFFYTLFRYLKKVKHAGKEVSKSE